MSSQLLSLGAWYILPNLVTGWVQSFYYRATIRVGDAMPQPGQARFARDRRYIFMFVVVSYLLYTVYEADWELQRAGDFFRDLGLPLDVDERRLQTRFRRLTVQYHPDKLNNPTPQQILAAESYFVHLKSARDTLLDPAKRFAYERFGPDMLEWKHCVTEWDFVKAGFQRIVPYYVVSALALIFISFVGYVEYGKYWQYGAMAALLTFELHTVTRPHFPIITSKLINPFLESFAIHSPYLPFQTIQIVRKIALSFFIAAAQISPQFRTVQPLTDSPHQRQQQMDQLTAMTRAIDGDTSTLVELEMAPFATDEALKTRLKESLKSWLVTNEIRNDPGVQAAIQAAAVRRAGCD